MSCHGHLPPVDRKKVSSVSILAAEHDVILQTLSCLEAMVATMAHGAPIPTSDAKKVIEILKLFADRCHHGKEEDTLFPALESIHGPDFGPTVVMRADHVQGRHHIAEMGNALSEKHAGKFCHHAMDYCELLREHIYKENEILFRIAQDCLSEEQDRRILQRYREIEHEDMGNGTHERLLALADELAVTYEVPRASQNPETMALLMAVCGCAESPSDDSADPWPRLHELSRKVAAAHGQNHSEMAILCEAVSMLASATPKDRPEKIKALDKRFRELTADFRPWKGSCGTVAALYEGLEKALVVGKEV